MPTTKRRKRYLTGNGDLRAKVRKFFENRWAWIDAGDSLRRFGSATGANEADVYEAFAAEFPEHHRELVKESERTGILIPQSVASTTRTKVTAIREAHHADS